MSGIVLTDLTKSYGAFPVLRGISLTVEPGELFGFLGPNGAGKTTTIKIMTGLLLPSGGRVEVAGYDVVEDPYEVKRRVGFVPDRPFLYDKLTGSEFLEFVGHLYDLSPATVRERSRDLIERFDLGEWIDELIEAYSHGMRQKLAITSALLHEPEIIIIDEPTVGLDPRSQSRMKTLLSNLIAKGQTVFLSTHTLEIVEALCTRVAIIHRGQIIALGTVDELRREARREDSSLEEIFLGLTEGGGSIDERSLV
ncbi:MAG: ABC transporter ATP-binding protein [Gemmatimonadetes bacterium]|nr:ABC transporter ATP-binding protein [Gemmatimonadota bacterium]